MFYSNLPCACLIVMCVILSFCDDHQFIVCEQMRELLMIVRVMEISLP